MLYISFLDYKILENKYLIISLVLICEKDHPFKNKNAQIFSYLIFLENFKQAYPFQEKRDTILKFFYISQKKTPSFRLSVFTSLREFQKIRGFVIFYFCYIYNLNILLSLFCTGNALSSAFLF